jgi:predicted metal-dependent hydrolase
MLKNGAEYTTIEEKVSRFADLDERDEFITREAIRLLEKKGLGQISEEHEEVAQSLFNSMIDPVKLREKIEMFKAKLANNELSGLAQFRAKNFVKYAGQADFPSLLMREYLRLGK